MATKQELFEIFADNIKGIFGDSLCRILVYGSYARGDYNEHSDIDIMILTSLSETEIRAVEDEVYSIAYELELQYGIHISVIINNETHYTYWLGAYPFYDNIQKEGVVIG